jgi:asparagine synthase (glutamine-hydrolysing)
MMERHVPAEITQRVKQGFSAPDASWFRGESIDYVRRVLFEEEPLLYEYLDADVVRELVEEHVSGRENRRLLVWSLLCVEQWCRTFLVGQRPTAMSPAAGFARE